MVISPSLPSIPRNRVRDHLVSVTLDTSAVGAFAWHRDDDTVEITSSHAKLTGLEVLEGRVRAEAFFERVHSQDIGRLKTLIGKAEREDAPYEAEFRFLRPDGREVWLGGRGRFHRAEGRKANSLMGANFDLTRLMRAEQAAEDLASEMAHRLGNQLATIQGMARLIVKSYPKAKAYHQALSARLDAFQIPTRIAMGAFEGGLTAKTIAALTLEPFKATGKIRIQADAVALSQSQATALSLALHELATNALKHGAMSHARGKTEVKLMQKQQGFRLIWAEDNGRDLGDEEPTPSHEGFGTIVLTRMVRQGGGSPKKTWTRRGLHYQIDWSAEIREQI